MTVVTKTKVHLDQLRSREAELTEQVEAKRARISGYPEKIAEENRNLVYAGKRPLTQLNSPLQKLRDAEKKDVTSLATLEGELSAVRSVIAEEDVRVREQATAEARAKLAERHELEESAWTKAGSVFAELADAYRQYVTIAKESISYASSNGLNASDALAITPAPASFKEFVALLLKAATDAEVRAEPFTEQLIDSGNFRTEHGGVVYDVRPAGTRTIEVRRRLDERDRLFHLVPDLRSVVRAPKG
jgi:hypothetical protein